MRRSPGKGEWQEFASSPLGLGTVEILFGGRVWIFVWCWLGGVGDGCGVAWDEFVVVAEEDDSLVTRPIPTKGIPLDDCNASREAIRGTLSRFDAKSCCLAVIVRPDSYGVFKQVRDQAIALKFDYRLLPTEADSPIVTAEARVARCNEPGCRFESHEADSDGLEIRPTIPGEVLRQASAFPWGSGGPARR